MFVVKSRPFKTPSNCGISRVISGKVRISVTRCRRRPSSRLPKAFCGRTTRFDYGKPRKLPILRLRKQCSLCPLGGRFPRLLPRSLTRSFRVSSFPFASRYRWKKASRGGFFMSFTSVSLIFIKAPSRCQNERRSILITINFF